MAQIRRRPSVTLGIQQNGPSFRMNAGPSTNMGPTPQDVQAMMTAQAQQAPQIQAQRGSMMQQPPQPVYQPGPNWPQNNAAPGPSWTMLDALKQQPDASAQASQAADQAQRFALANSLNYKTSVPVNRGGTIFQEPPRDVHGNITVPSHSQLQTQFSQLPTWKQVQIYKAGGAPFLDNDNSGADLLQQNTASVEGALKDQIGELGKMVANGTMTFDPSDRKFYQMLTDPNNPETGLKKKVPISLLQAQLYKMGVERGMLPDADTLYKQQMPQTNPGTSAQSTTQTPGLNPNASFTNGLNSNIPTTTNGQPSPFFKNGPINFPEGEGLNPTATKVRSILGSGNDSDSNLQDNNYNAIAALRNVPNDIYNSLMTIKDLGRKVGDTVGEISSGDPSAPFIPSPRASPYPYAGGFYHPTDIPGSTGNSPVTPWSVPDNPSQSGITSPWPANDLSPKLLIPSNYPR